MNSSYLNVEKAAKSLRYPQISVEVPRVNWLKYYKRLTQIPSI
ncbi:hypothetical protein [Clostridium sp.]|nr:hypothetical protein [Clostridium sp.]